MSQQNWRQRWPELEKQDKEFQTGSEAILAAMEPAELPTLFHYTTGAGLSGILQTRKLWATAINYVNDNQELFHGNTKIENGLRNQLTGQDPELGGLFWGKLYEALPGYSIEQGDTRSDLFICCFCETGDLLSQWRGYAALGGGYALGLRPVGFERKNEGNQAGTYKLRKVVYEPGIQDRLTEMVVSFTSSFYFDEIKKVGRDRTQAGLIADDLTEYVCYRVSELIYCLKHPSFSEEQEWRIAHELPYSEGYPEVKFRTSGGNLVPYVELDLFSEEKSTRPGFKLVSITHGPTLETRSGWTKKALHMLAERSGFPDCEIQGSDIPLNA